MSSSSPSSWSYDDIFFNYVAPFLGCLIASSLFAAPIKDLRLCLLNGKLGPLNPIPWAFMTGNTFGWVTYGYLKNDPFLIASNMPGLILSLWLNIGASKLQYAEHMMMTTRKLMNDSQYQYHHQSSSSQKQKQQQQHLDPYERSNGSSRSTNRSNGSISFNINDNSKNREIYRSSNGLIFTSQDVWFLRVVVSWAVVLIIVGWLGVPKQHGQLIVGIFVNTNLLVFYAAPLSTMWTCIETKTSNSIHTPTMILNCGNATFWSLYGIAQHDVVIWGPNALGLSLGVAQALLCIWYPKTTTSTTSSVPVGMEMGVESDYSDQQHGGEIEFQPVLRTTDDPDDDMNIRTGNNDAGLADASDLNDDDDDDNDEYYNDYGDGLHRSGRNIPPTL
mmetsp:Transcript_38496/g.93309  ORF Transcript_38496/g.93309 Transcript_38496/m.93309 type:complete len:389 (+) Transcript_38496:147-1313(+)